MGFFKKKNEKENIAEKTKEYLFNIDNIFSTHSNKIKENASSAASFYEQQAPIGINVGTMDDESGGAWPALKTSYCQPSLSSPLINWYTSSSSFIGYQLCAMIAQNWLVDKACTMPARDATRTGYEISAAHGKKLPLEAMEMFKFYDKKYHLMKHLIDFIRFGRIFGIRIAIFKVDSHDPDYYFKPFNIDGVTPGSYKGIVTVDPYWCAPLLDKYSSSEADNLHFYEPTWWIINGKKYHRSHLIIFRNSPPADILKPQYLYGGVPLTQRIYERVYAAERTANEAPLLTLTKRVSIWMTDMAAFASAGNNAIQRVSEFSQYRDNYGIQIGDKIAEEFQQHDISLTDLDSVIMGQYQIVSAISEVPSTKLLGTSSKGFNATGEHESRSYHESLESIQTHDCTPLVERHHELVMKSFCMPKLNIDFIETNIFWRPLDSPTAEEIAKIELMKAQIGAIYTEIGAIDSSIEHDRLAADKNSEYSSLLGTDDGIEEESE